MIALIDGDIVAYRAAAYHERHCDGETGESLRDNSFKMAEDTALKWLEGSGAEKAFIFFTFGDSFRKALYPEYKKQREDYGRPIYLSETKLHLMALAGVDPRFAGWRSRAVPQLEADDLISITLSDPNFADRSVAVSIDKDFLQVPGRHYNPTDSLHSVVTPASGLRTQMVQWLQGDRVDNLKGVPKVGPVKAGLLVDKWLGDEGLGWHEPGAEDVVFREGVKLFVSKGIPAETAVAEFNCIRLLRAGEWDFDAGAVKPGVLRVPFPVAPRKEP